MLIRTLTALSQQPRQVHGLQNKRPNSTPYVEGNPFLSPVRRLIYFSNIETGWPSAGNSNGAAVASPENQAIAKASILSAMKNQCVLFSAFDDLWKSPGEYNVEQHWVRTLIMQLMCRESCKKFVILPIHR